MRGVEKVGEGPEDESVGVEKDDLGVLGEAEEVELGEGGGQVATAWARANSEVSFPFVPPAETALQQGSA